LRHDDAGICRGIRRHEDTAAAIAWLHDHAAEFGGDPGRIFLLGISAGAQLAAVELEIGTAGDKPTSAIAEFIDRLSAAPDAEAPAWVTPVVTAPRVRFQTFHSAAAKAKVSYHLYTPAIYDQEPERKFPVLYWLHGSGEGWRASRNSRGISTPPSPAEKRRPSWWCS